jgi:hypothetical protein
MKIEKQMMNFINKTFKKIQFQINIIRQEIYII